MVGADPLNSLGAGDDVETSSLSHSHSTHMSPCLLPFRNDSADKVSSHAPAMNLLPRSVKAWEPVLVWQSPLMDPAPR